MKLYYDSSAIVPLLIQERYSSQSRTLWQGMDSAYGWTITSPASGRDDRFLLSCRR